MRRRRHRVEHHFGLGERQVVGAGDLAGEAARRRAVVDIDQAALCGFLQHRRQRRFRRGEARTHVVGDADIALEPAHLPGQAIDVLVEAERTEQRLRAGIIVGVVERLHRRLQKELVAVGACLGRKTLDVGAIRREGEGHRAGQLADRLTGDAGADAEAAEHDGDLRAGLLARSRLGGAGVDLGRAGAVGADARDRTVARDLQQLCSSGARTSCSPGSPPPGAARSSRR